MTDRNMEAKSTEANPASRISFFTVLFLGILLLASVVALVSLAQSFPYEKKPGRPIVEVVVLSWIASALVLAAVFFGLKVDPDRRRSLLGAVFLFAVGFRVILVFSNPILEVDFYRYLWDGIAANQGVSPYKFSPDTVVSGVSTDPELTKLQDHIAAYPSAKTIASRVHFEKYTTLYPPVSQYMFRGTTWLIPDDASAWTHMVAIKSMLTLFDIGVVLCLAWIIGVLRMHPAWLIVYAWNPLVLKEVANGGHLDSIAVFFFTAGISVLLWIVKRTEKESLDDTTATKPGPPRWASSVSGAFIGLGIGAKLFPIVVVPFLFVFLWTKGQIRQSILFAATCAVVSTLVLWPMINQQVDNSEHATQNATEPLPMGETSDGLGVFMSHWRMNDAIFSFVYQNVEYDWGDRKPAWYVFVPNETRTQWCQGLANVQLANGNPSYFVARIVTVILFGVFYLWTLLRIRKIDSASELANTLFLIMGVFFILQPTQNPWYWVWAMPLVCFAKNRGWLFVSMALWVYYLRFWFEEKQQSFEFLGNTYVGVDFYDHCVVWMEFLAIVGVVLAAAIWTKFRSPKK